MSLVKRIARTTLAMASVLLGFLAVTGATLAQDRSLTLYHTHTKESATITFKRNGRFDADGLSKLNTFLRDWRTNEPTKMDPALLDLLWAVYTDVGATKPINIVSSYRSPKTNAALRANSSGVAENSQHIRGKAMDFFIPGVNLATLRATAMKRQGGGVGYYPTSGSPFVHLDTGSVRAWPRMTTAQLLQVFPDGNTAHIPSNGVPLPGHRTAVAELSKPAPVPVIAVAPKPNLFERLFTRTPQPAPVQVPAAQPPQIAAVAVEERLVTPPTVEFNLNTGIASVAPVVPPRRPDSVSGQPVQLASVAPVPVPRPSWLGSTAVAAAAPLPEVDVIDGDYVLLGYNRTRQVLGEQDPFAFLKDLETVPSGSQMAAALQSPVKVVEDQVVPASKSGTDPAMLVPSQMSDLAFAEFTAPDGQDVRFMLETPDKNLAGYFQSYLHVVPKRF